MGLFDKLFGRKKKEPTPSAGELARERLTLMLVHDRLKLTPDLLNRIKGELLAVISKYVEIDETGVDIELTHSEHSDKLVARMPVRRQRLPFNRDVLEPGMGNPLVAAAALAKIHQPAGAATAERPLEATEAASPLLALAQTATTGEATPSASQPPIEPAATPAPALAGVITAQAPAAPATSADETSAPATEPDEAAAASSDKGGKRRTAPKKAKASEEPPEPAAAEAALPASAGNEVEPGAPSAPADLAGSEKPNPIESPGPTVT